LRFYIDTEFIEDGKTIDLISIGIVADKETEPTLYLQNLECDFSKASDWVRRNVLLQLPEFNIGNWRPLPDVKTNKSIWCTKVEIGTEVLNFINRNCPWLSVQGGGQEKPEFWGWYSDYDWVVLCQLYGTMMDLPKNWPQFCMDIKQLAVMKGNPNVKQAVPIPEGVHNALEDAKWNKKVYEYLCQLSMNPS